MPHIVQYNIFNDIVPLFLKDLWFCKIQKFQIVPLHNLKLRVKIVPSASADNIDNIAHVHTGVHLIYQHRDAAF